ncbi:MAG: MBOAT family O-acyltransferase [Oscillospiraceae bacterium]
MVFNTPTFLIFMGICMAVYYALPHRWQNPFLLAASYVCYMWAIPQYAVLILFTTAFSFFAAKAIAAESGQKKRRAVFIIGIIVPLVILFIFKYFNFFMGGVQSLLAVCGVVLEIPKLSWILPLGISFYTFQVLGYTIDIYNRNTEPESNFVTYALFISFFPQVLAGPIGRARELIPQYKCEHVFDYAKVACGAQRFLTGLFKKIVLADGLAVIVDGVYGSLKDYLGFSLVIAVVLYALQLYFDFSGYSDMAIGSAQMLGFTLRENFAAPYFATDMSGFWKRWHMSLTSWFNDYIFTPLVWSRWVNKLIFGKKWDEHKPHFAANIIIVFAISGLWHGAGLSFAVWGLLNGAYRVIEEMLHRIMPRKRRAENRATIAAKRILVFLLFAISLVFFRAASIADAVYVFKNMFTAVPFSVIIEQIRHLSSNGISISGIYFMIFWGILMISLVLGFALDVRVNRSLAAKGAKAITNPVGTYGKKLRWAIYWFMGISSMFFYFIGLTGQRGSGSFIYFGF